MSRAFLPFQGFNAVRGRGARAGERGDHGDRACDRNWLWLRVTMPAWIVESWLSQFSQSQNHDTNHSQQEGVMHGIHISHNNISDKGAFRLIRAAAMCGHYPRYTSRLPLWLRLESNDIQSPFKLIADCNAENFNVCLMKDGMCSRPTCNHYSGVHVQLPYFFHQGSSHKGPMERQNPIDHTPPPIATPSMPAKKIKDAEEMLSIFRGGADEDKDKTPQGHT
jgi:hypothetical protein